MEKPNNHYKKCIIEPIDAIKQLLTLDEYRGFLKGNVIKYRFRAGHKTEGDIEKAMQYETWYRELLEKQRIAEEAKATTPVPTMLQVVNRIFPEVTPSGCGCPFREKYKEAFQSAGYEVPVNDYVVCDSMTCEQCWNRKAKPVLQLPKKPVVEPPVKPEEAMTMDELWDKGVEDNNHYCVDFLRCATWYLQKVKGYENVVCPPGAKCDHCSYRKMTLAEVKDDLGIED